MAQIFTQSAKLIKDRVMRSTKAVFDELKRKNSSPLKNNEQSYETVSG
ncbi:MAG: hypothetical protein JWP93_239 [Polaromonas sp.]|nr:hypothetical protein [Polaromonas sp.]